MKRTSLLSRGFAGLTVILAVAPVMALVLAYLAPGQMILMGPFALSLGVTGLAGWIFGKRRLVAGLIALVGCLAFSGWLYVVSAGLNIWILLYLAVIAAGALFLLRITPYAAGHELLPGQLAPALGVHMLAALLIRMEGFVSAGPWLAWITPAFFLCGLMIMNRSTLADGVAARRGGNAPKRILWPNRILLGIFVLAVLVLVNLHRIRDGFYWVVEKVTLFILWIMYLISSLHPGSESGGDGGGGGGMDLSGLGEPGEPSWLALFLEQVFKVLAVVIMVVLILFALYKLSKLLVRLYRKLAARIASYASALGESYEDEAESVFDWGELRKNAEDRAKELLARLRARRVKWADLDDRGKVRFVYQTLLKKRPELPPGKTARSIIQNGDLPLGQADAQIFARDYDAARYSDQPIGPQAAENAHRALE